jgi:membrane protease YdiL (CAAX protease family)
VQITTWKAEDKGRRIAIVTFSVIATLYLGVASSRVIKPVLNSYGIEKNWAWPTLCIVVGALFSGLVSRKINWATTIVCLETVLGIVAGLILQLLFYLARQRDWFSFQGMTLGALAFQIYVSWAEEFLFRGRLQQFLQERIRLPLAVVLVSFPFALIHGLNPVLFNHASFDFNWFTGTFIVSVTAGLSYGRRESLACAFGIHIGYNVIATFF